MAETLAVPPYLSLCHLCAEPPMSDHGLLMEGNMGNRA
jgi:hypothetical protein